MEVEEHHDAVRAAEGDHGRDPIEVGGVEPAAYGLERAPADRQAEQVQAEARHGGRVAVVEHGDRLEREAAVAEGDVEDASTRAFTPRSVTSRRRSSTSRPP